MRDTMSNETIRNTGELLQQTIGTATSLVEQSAQIAMDFLNALTDSMGKNVPASGVTPILKLPKMHSCCKIPPPCWMPREAGHVVSHVCAGSAASIWICVSNCGIEKRTITFDDAGKGVITFDPATLVLGPMEEGEVKATFTPPASAGHCEGGEHNAIVWIHGCKEHYLRWTLKNVKRGVSCSCHEIRIEDCPDYLHHWYDHFYCHRPCTHHGRKG